MAYKFGRKSKQRLAQCHKDLQFLANEAIKIIDFKITEGHRGKKRQNQLLIAKATTKEWPNSKHNKLPSEAFDSYPYPVVMPDEKKQKKKEFAKNLARFYLLVGIFKGLALAHNIKIRCGADWDNDGEILDNTFDDLPHIEILLD